MNRFYKILIANKHLLSRRKQWNERYEYAK